MYEIQIWFFCKILLWYCGSLAKFLEEKLRRRRCCHLISVKKRTDTHVITKTHSRLFWMLQIVFWTGSSFLINRWRKDSFINRSPTSQWWVRTVSLKPPKYTSVSWLLKLNFIFWISFNLHTRLSPHCFSWSGIWTLTKPQSITPPPMIASSGWLLEKPMT